MGGRCSRRSRRLYVEEANHQSHLIPEGVLRRREPPDFLLVAAAATIGIEVISI